MTTLTKANLGSNVWETFYDRMVANVTSVTLKDASTKTIQTYTSSFPDSESEAKSDYPIIVIEPVDITWDPHTFTKKHAMGTITISVYTTKSEAADLFLDAIRESIETYRSTLSGLGLEFVDLDSSSSDSAIRGGFKVHLRSVTFSFQYTFSKTWP